MRLKLKSILSLTLLIIGFTLYSCVDEPYIEPVKHPVSSIRVVNVSNNVSTFKVEVYDQDGNIIKSFDAVQQGSATEFFDVPSGKRRFVVYGDNNAVILDKELDIISYDRVDVLVSGNKSDVTESNSFTMFIYDEGEYYINTNSKADSVQLVLIHASSTVDTVDSKEYKVVASIPAASFDSTLIDSSSSLKYGTARHFNNLPAGDYTFNFINIKVESAKQDTTTYSATLSANRKYYLFLYGNPNNVQVFNNEVTPPPVRSRD